MAEICKTAGVPNGSFYYFFESEENLGLAVLDDHSTTQRDHWQRLLGNRKNSRSSDCDSYSRKRPLCYEPRRRVAGTVLG
jgi:AcrR family transcriptional regulator